MAVLAELLSPAEQKEANKVSRAASASQQGSQSKIHKATFCADVPAVKRELANWPANVTCKDAHGQTPLHLLALTSIRAQARLRMGYAQPPPEGAIIRTLKLLLENGADVAAVDSSGNSPLHVAALGGAPAEVVRLMLSAGSKASPKHIARQVMVLAVQCGKQSVALAALPFALEEAGASRHSHPVNNLVPVTSLSLDSKTSILHLAAAARMVDLTSAILRRVSSPFVTDGHLSTPLHLALGAVYHGENEIADTLHATSPVPQPSSGIRPQNDAATLKCVHLILAHAKKLGKDQQLGAAVDQLKRTPFHWAAIGCSARVMMQLLTGCTWDAGTLRAIDSVGKTALDYATERNNRDVLLALQEALSHPPQAQVHPTRRSFLADGVSYDTDVPTDPLHVALLSRESPGLGGADIGARMLPPFNPTAVQELALGAADMFRLRAKPVGHLRRAVLAMTPGLWGGMSIAAPVDVRKLDSQVTSDAETVPTAESTHEAPQVSSYDKRTKVTQTGGLAEFESDAAMAVLDRGDVDQPSSAMLQPIGPYDSSAARADDISREARAAARGVNDLIMEPVYREVRRMLAQVKTREGDKKVVKLLTPPQVSAEVQLEIQGSSGGANQSNPLEGQQTKLWSCLPESKGEPFATEFQWYEEWLKDIVSALRDGVQRGKTAMWITRKVKEMAEEAAKVYNPMQIVIEPAVTVGSNVKALEYWMACAAVILLGSPGSGDHAQLGVDIIKTVLRDLIQMHTAVQGWFGLDLAAQGSPNLAPSGQPPFSTSFGQQVAGPVKRVVCPKGKPHLHGLTLTQMAVWVDEAQQPDLMDWLSSHMKVDFRVTSEVGRNELHVCCAKGNAMMTRFLLEKGVDPTAADDFGYTPFHFAVLNDHYEVVATLMEFGAYTAQPTREPLLLRIDSNADAAAIWKETGVEVQTYAEENLRLAQLPASVTPSDLARVMGHDRMKGHVQDYINAWKDAGWSPLFWAALNGYPLSIWRWLSRMTPQHAQQAMGELTWKEVTLYTLQRGDHGLPERSDSTVPERGNRSGPSWGLVHFKAQAGLSDVADGRPTGSTCKQFSNGWTPMHQVPLYAWEARLPADKAKALIRYLVLEMGWDPSARLDIECHIGDKVYHRGVSPRVVAASNRLPQLSKLIDQVDAEFQAKGNTLSATVSWLINHPYKEDPPYTQPVAPSDVQTVATYMASQLQEDPIIVDALLKVGKYHIAQLAGSSWQKDVAPLLPHQFALKIPRVEKRAAIYRQLRIIFSQLLNPRESHPCAPFLRNTLNLEHMVRHKSDIAKTIKRPPSRVDLHSIGPQPLIDPQTEALQQLAAPSGELDGLIKHLESDGVLAQVPPERVQEIQGMTVGQLAARHVALAKVADLQEPWVQDSSDFIQGWLPDVSVREARKGLESQERELQAAALEQLQTPDQLFADGLFSGAGLESVEPSQALRQQDASAEASPRQQYWELSDASRRYKTGASQVAVLAASMALLPDVACAAQPLLTRGYSMEASLSELEYEDGSDTMSVAMPDIQFDEEATGADPDDPAAMLALDLVCGADMELQEDGAPLSDVGSDVVIDVPVGMEYKDVAQLEKEGGALRDVLTGAKDGTDELRLRLQEYFSGSSPDGCDDDTNDHDHDVRYARSMSPRERIQSPAPSAGAAGESEHSSQGTMPAAAARQVPPVGQNPFKLSQDSQDTRQHAAGRSCGARYTLSSNSRRQVTSSRSPHPFLNMYGLEYMEGTGFLPSDKLRGPASSARRSSQKRAVSFNEAAWGKVGYVTPDDWIGDGPGTLCVQPKPPHGLGREASCTKPSTAASCDVKLGVRTQQQLTPRGRIDFSEELQGRSPATASCAQSDGDDFDDNVLADIVGMPHPKRKVSRVLDSDPAARTSAELTLDSQNSNKRPRPELSDNPTRLAYEMSALAVGSGPTPTLDSFPLSASEVDSGKLAPPKPAQLRPLLDCDVDNFPERQDYYEPYVETRQGQVRVVLARAVETFDQVIEAHSGASQQPWIVVLPDPSPLLLHSEMLRLTVSRGGDFSEGILKEKGYIDLYDTFPRAVEVVVRSLSSGHMNYLPENFATMLDVSINYNIPVAIEAVVNSANAAVSAALEGEGADLDQRACGLEIARQVVAMWYYEDTPLETWGGDLWFLQTRGMVHGSAQILQMLGWDGGKEFVVYQLRAGTWKPESVWEGLATGSPDLVTAPVEELQQVRKQLDAPLLLSVPFTWLCRILAGLQSEQMRVQAVIEAASARSPGDTHVAGFTGLDLQAVHHKWVQLSGMEQDLLLRLSDSTFVAKVSGGKAIWPTCVFQAGWNSRDMLEHMLGWAQQVRILLRLLSQQYQLWQRLVAGQSLDVTQWALSCLWHHLDDVAARWETCLGALQHQQWS